MRVIPLLKEQNLKRKFMKKNILCIMILIVFLSIKCQDNNNNKLENKENMLKINNNLNDSEINEILKNQLIYGQPLNDDFYTPYNFSEKDYNILVPYLAKILEKNNYNSLSSEDFFNKIKIIFQREIDFRKPTKYIKVNFLNRCDYNPLFQQNNIIDYFGIIINKEKKFISDFYAIPEILDYQKFNGIVSYENSLPKTQKNKNGTEIPLILWKDVVNLNEQRYFNQQLLVHRNKYLFNDNKASFGWLKFNDEYFLESLVKVFGYTKDKDLLAWVMKRNEEEAKAEEFINSFLFVRNCKGEMEIRDGILKYIEENTTDNEKSQNFVSKLGSYYVESPNYSWTEKERFKIIAYIANTYDYLYKKSSTLGNTNKGRISFLGSIFFRSNKNDNEKSWNELIKNFKENNYYHLPHLQEAVDHAYEYENFEL